MSAIHHVAPLLTALFRAVLQASWQGALAIVLVLIVRRVFGARVPARWHYLLWFLVLVRLLVPTSVLPHSPASLENIHAVAQPFGRQPLPSTDQGASRGMTMMMPPALPASHGVTSSRPPAAAVPDVTSHPWSWPAFAALAWLAGAVSLCFWLTACSLNLRRRMNRETVPADADLAALWQACCRRWLRRPAPPILTATWVHSPALVGAWWPTLLLPRQTADSFSAQDWEHVFAHEIAHLRWRDHWSQLVLLAAWCVHWFNPVVWLGMRRLRADRELAADEWVLVHLRGERALAYGETLYKTLAHRPARLVFQPGMVGISEDGTQMKQRLRRIVAFLPQRRVYGSLAGFAAVLGLGTVVLGQGSSKPVIPPPAKAAAEPSATPAATSVESVAAESRKLSDAMLAAARADDGKEISRLLESTYQSSAKPGLPLPPKFSEEAATAMLDDLVHRRELAAFTVLHDQLKQTNYGKDWKPDDALLASLVKDGRTDFLDILLARRLDLDRLTTAAKSAGQPTAAWIARRVAEVAKQRADIEALEKAADQGDLAAMKQLIDGGADVNGVGKDDHTPLLHTVFKNRLEAAQFLIDHGALVDKPRYPGWDYTPLCLVNTVPMAELLKRNGANVHAKLFRRDVSILTYVVRFAGTDVVKWFLQQGLDPNMIGSNDKNLLFGLANGRTATLLLDAGVDPNRICDLGSPPICWARSAEVAQALIDHGAKLTGFKKPLLTMMIQFASADAVEAALKAQTNPDHNEIQQALMDAAFGEHPDTARVLLKYGAKPNEPTAWWGDPKDKMWPLMACTINSCPKTAQVLIDAGADPNGGDRPGEFLRNALGNRHNDVAVMLRKAGAKDVSDLVYATAIHDEITIEAMLPHAPPYAENPVYWEDVLPTAARVGNLEVLRAALAKGAPPAVQESAYETAASEGQDEALAILLAARKPGDDPAALRNALGSAVFNSHPYPQQRTAEHFVKCVQMLLNAGAHAGNDQTPDNLMMEAVFTRNPGGNPTVMEILARAGANPNPPTPTKNNPHARLLDAAQEPNARESLSAQVVETLARLNHLAPPAPADEPAHPTSPDSGSHAGEPPAMFGHDISATGTVFMADGTPLGGEEIVATAYSFRGTGGFMVSPQRVENGSFPLYLDEHTTRATVAVAQKGCAVVFVGPFDAANMDQLNHLHVELTHGYTATVQVVDQAGHPIAGARLRPYYACPSNAELPLEETTTDAGGSAAIEHVGEAPLNIRVSVDGFQADEATGLHIDPAKPYRWTLQPTPPLHGMVTAAATGQPIAGAVIKLAGVRGPHNETHFDPRQAPVLTNADAQGRFTLGSLRPDSRYYLFVAAPGYGGAYLREVKLMPGEMNVALGPELLIRGKLIHVPASVIHLGKVHLQYSQSFGYDDNFSGAASETTDVLPVNGEADFVVGPFYKVPGGSVVPKNAPLWETKTVGLYVDAWGRAEFSVDELPVSNFVFDLARKTDDRAAPEADAEPKPASVGRSDVPTKEPPSAASPAPTATDQAAPVPGAEAIVLHQGHFADGVTSLQFGETLGKVPENYSKLLWQEVGDAYRLDDIRVDKTVYGQDRPKGLVSNWHRLISYDGQRTYEVDPGDQRVITQRAPLTHTVSDYNGSIRGPLMAFEFLDTVDQPREKLLTLQSPEHLAAVAKRATLQPGQNRVWNGHPCLAVKITDGYNRWPTAVDVSPTGYANSNDVTDVDYIAYFATDLDLYPVGWEMFNKQGEKIYTYWVKHLESIRLAKEGDSVFRYPDVAVFHNNAFDKIGGIMQEEITFFDVEVNTLKKENFTLASILAIYAKDGDMAKLELLEDRDTRKLTDLQPQ